MNKTIRTRYAPSPTGYLHIGGARTALFCYLFAKHSNGDFIFRLEDTDVERNVEGGEASQLNNLAWLGIVPDESPLKPNPKYGKYRQSEKLAIYQAYIDELIKQGLAYKAYDSSEELAKQHEEQEKAGVASFRYDPTWLKLSESEIKRRDEAKEYSIRLKLPKNKNYSWDDLVRGPISVNSDDIGDFVIMKSDGYPTYNFAVVVDDHQMDITHVLRGEEHITNTPKQLAIYEAFGWDNPVFGHLTIITNMEGKKLSKRDKSLKQFIEDYKNEGYCPEAIFNFLALLGWTSGDKTEIMSHDELIKKFDYNRLSKSPSKFDIVKMEWFSKQYMKKLPNEVIIEKINSPKDAQWNNLFVETYKQQAATISEIKENLKIYLFPKEKLELQIDNDLVVKTFFAHLKAKDFTIENIQAAIDETKNALNVKGKDLFMPIRITATYEEHGPELAKAIYLFGKDLVYKRLTKWS
ncbi:Glutamate--tRNA ligase [Metamycoplasma arthritidis]|uniref:Glutamate--tRNA ligase n=1 Tax=Metamycoplasma arthritidis (strain 158L3-1) TaxID=243272 RepID=SYE_META1|nr:glutamate--tRNA ligase [Metamycoplasma arthritidis]B3PN19.1 RecName: Full=Glutamate--tRNA ligase; AltName: Full=Glutamyl-tRNA synthetase; Short=GluRS [Metamycoplasma arthritidis 158L3-1]ACF07421.1 glutamyl-tRNA synthetase [Metamycoplasma arthritidis 158L3-1]VEU78943.1 Glutamate--tRNA ligase [Metamycoplasma arthritidis]